jgi:hypothetical protein
MFYSYR